LVEYQNVSHLIVTKYHTNSSHQCFNLWPPNGAYCA